MVSMRMAAKLLARDTLIGLASKNTGLIVPGMSKADGVTEQVGRTPSPLFAPNGCSASYPGRQNYYARR